MPIRKVGSGNELGGDFLRPLNIAVCVKPVPDPKQSANLRIDPATKTLIRQGIPLVINPLDKHALEAAVSLKEAAGGRVAVFSMAPPAAEQTLAEALAMGADEAFLLSDLSFAGGDTLATARVLAAGLKKVGSWDVVLCGAESFDGGTAQVGPQLAVLLGMSWVTRVTRLVRESDDQFLVTVEDEVEQRDLAVRLPVVLTVEHAVNRPRKLSLMGILAARNKKVVVYSADDLDVERNAVGLKGSPTQTRDLFAPQEERKCEFLNGTPQEIANALLDKLGW